MTAPDKDRVTMAWVARRFGVAERRVNGMADRGEIPVHRVEEFVTKDGDPGTRNVYSQAETEAFLRRRGELAADRSMGLR